MTEPQFASREPRVGQALNRALHQAFASFDDLFLLGEDVLDPYGGAFKITSGLSALYPDRVLTTPLSEGAVLGIANGLAMCGHRVIVEVMFGDFAALAFDQLLNLTTKSVTMYGRHYPMPVLMRCPVGGRRGYGPTHSQSPHKHFIGIPNLALYELSPFHDIGRNVTDLLTRTEPSILFEDKVTYTERLFPGAGEDAGFERSFLGDGDWAEMRMRRQDGRPIIVIIAPGGVGRRALRAACELASDGWDTRVLVPFRLYPVSVAAVLGLLTAAEAVVVAEEGTAGGTWGNEVAARVHDGAWHLLRGPVRSVSSADSVIPAAVHLEREVLLSPGDIVAAVRASIGHSLPSRPGPVLRAGQSANSAAPVAPAGTTPESTAPPGAAQIVVPKLNNNDESYLLVSWLVADGQEVLAGQPVAEIETSKATQELTAEADGVLRQLRQAGADCRPGEVIAILSTCAAGIAGDRADPAAEADTGTDTGAESGAVVLSLSSAQRQVAQVVAASHRDIPAAFVVVRTAIDALLACLDRLMADAGPQIGLAEVVIKAIGNLRADHPLLFATLRPDLTLQVPASADVGVTVDMGNGLCVPVLRDVGALSADDVADQLTDLRMRALRGRLAERDLAGANIAVSLNIEDGVVLVQPIIPPGLAAIVSVAGIQELAWPDGDGLLAIKRTVDIGLAYDHRLVNGKDATAFLGGLKKLLEQPGWLEDVT